VFSVPFDLFLSSSHHWQHDRYIFISIPPGLNDSQLCCVSSDWNGMRFHLHHFYYYSPPSLYYITPGSEEHAPAAVTSTSSLPPHPRLSFSSDPNDISVPTSASPSNGSVVVGSRAWTVWGLTAFILIKASQIAYGRSASFDVLPPTILPMIRDPHNLNAVIKALSPSSRAVATTPSIASASVALASPAAIVASYASSSSTSSSAIRPTVRSRL
jgi:hypothetical protein